MEGFHEGFVSFWETLTGVLDDDRSKIIRLSCFVLLFLGIIWAGLNYFQAERISNLDEDVDSYKERNKECELVFSISFSDKVDGVKLFELFAKVSNELYF